MPIEFDYQAVIDAVFALVKATWTIPNNVPIFETGGEVVELGRRYDTAILERIGPITSGGNTSLKSEGRTLPLRIWRLDEKEEAEDPLTDMRVDLQALETAFCADETLGGLVSDIRVTSLDETGNSAESPFEVKSEEGATAGFLEVELFMEQVR